MRPPVDSLVRVWADGPTRHDAGKVRISASSRTQCMSRAHRTPAALRTIRRAAPSHRTRQPPVTASGSNVTRMRVIFPSSMCSQFAVGAGRRPWRAGRTMSGRPGRRRTRKATKEINYRN